MHHILRKGALSNYEIFTMVSLAFAGGFLASDILLQTYKDPTSHGPRPRLIRSYTLTDHSARQMITMSLPRPSMYPLELQKAAPHAAQGTKATAMDKHSWATRQRRWGANVFSAVAITAAALCMVMGRRGMALRSTSSGSDPGEVIHYAYLHGFLSGPTSKKGMLLKSVFQEHGLTLALLDLNQGDPATLSYSSAVDVVMRFVAEHPEGKIRLIGSSFGGYIAARCAELLPDRIDRIMLLCPAFDLGSRWPKIYGTDAMEQWRIKGTKLFTTSQGQEVIMPYSFIEDTQQHPRYPQWRCPAVIIQGQADDVVPEELIQEAVSANADLSSCSYLYVVDDDHALTASSTLELIEKVAKGFLMVSHSKAGTALDDSVPMQVEVERKFLVESGDQLTDLLQQAGAHLQGRERFEDSYWDTDDMCLLKCDHWLRKRAGVWELKRPSGLIDSSSTKATTYEEISDDPLAIANALSPVLGSQAADIIAAMQGDGSSNSSCVLAPFAEFVSERTKYQMGDIGVDIDKAQYGEGLGTYCVLELEKLVIGTGGNKPSEHDVRGAERRIADVAEQIRLSSSEQRVPGKLEYFLVNRRPHHWAALKKLLAALKAGNTRSVEKG